MNIQQFEALEPRKRDAWFAERFGWSGKEKTYAYPPYSVTLDIAGVPQGKGTFIEVTWRNHKGKKVKVDGLTTTNDGIAVLKAEMINKGFWWKSEYNDGGYIFTIQHVNDTFKYVIDAGTEIEATWKAAALALLGE